MAKELEVMSKETKIEKNTQSIDTAVFIDEYKGNPTLGVFQVDKDGKKLKEYPEIAVGMRKAKLLTKHFTELKNWVDGVQGK